MSASTAQVATISPAKPKLHEAITFVYNTADPSAKFKHEKEMTAEILLLRGEDPPLRLTVPLKEEGTTWRGSLTMSDPKGTMFLYMFSAAGANDDNGANVWDSFLYEVNGKPAAGSSLDMASVLMQGRLMEFTHVKDLDRAAKEIADVMAAEPDNWMAAKMGWSMRLRSSPVDSTKKTVGAEVEQMYQRLKGNESAVASLLPIFEQAGLKQRAEEIRKPEMISHPYGKVAKRFREAEIYSTNDPAQRGGLAEKFIQDFHSAGDELQRMQNVVVVASTVLKDYDKAVAFLAGAEHPSGVLYNIIAWQLIDSGSDVAKGVALAKKGVDLCRNPDPSGKAPYVSDAAWRENNQRSLGMVLDTYGCGLMKLGKYKEAEAPQAEAQQLTNGEDPDVNERTVECYVKNGKDNEAIGVAAKAVADDKSNDKLIALYKEAYIRKNGSDAGFDKMLSEAAENTAKKVREKALQSRINLPSVDFTLPDIAGNTVTLAGLKGKVVVIDFWATWCGPCLASFPDLQKVYDKYRSNPNVAIYAIDSWERVAGKEREDLVKKFLKENGYTIPVLYGDATITKYDVDGIPTKFVISKAGTIAFKSVGFEGDQVMIAELTAEIDALLQE
jgi:thiol-disulfide isomerase/thioredoxin